ncbi:MAG: endolytic transglycosylase MltG [Prevotella sp.]|nr:endolytic transglycosylase MltG [Prevotella sp.]
MKKKLNYRYVVPTIICLLAIAGLFYYYFFASFSSKKETQYVCIDRDDNIDSVFAKLEPIAKQHSLTGYKTMVRHTSYADHIRTGRYAVKPGEGAFTVFRHLKNGIQTPVNLTIPSVRSIDRIASTVGRKLMIDSAEVMQALNDPAVMKKYGFDSTSIACFFIPNTYDMYWNISLDKFLDRLKREHDNFWNADRTAKARMMGLTPNEVVTMASIIDEETADDAEKPMIAGMYFNRLKIGMPLQADPTVKFALKRWDLRRIWSNMLHVNSPYNTYMNVGLPPGPIRVPSAAGINAVLDYVHHDYLYMCAKEDFSGTHNFAVTYADHLKNAEKYSKALNERGIK